MNPIFMMLSLVGFLLTLVSLLLPLRAKHRAKRACISFILTLTSSLSVMSGSLLLLLSFVLASLLSSHSGLHSSSSSHPWSSSFLSFLLFSYLPMYFTPPYPWPPAASLLLLSSVLAALLSSLFHIFGSFLVLSNCLNALESSHIHTSWIGET